MAIEPKNGKAPAQNKPTKTAEERQKESIGTLKKLIHSMKDQLAAALPKHLTPDRIARIAMTAVSATPKLAECTQESFLGALLTSAQLGLEPNTKLGYAYLIPYERNFKVNGEWCSVLEVQFQIGYKGLIELCRRAGIYSAFKMNYVLPSCFFRVIDGFHRDLQHERKKADDGSYIDIGTPHTYYAIYKTKDGQGDFEYWSAEKALNHGKRFSKSYDSKAGKFREGSSWAEHFDQMAMKSVMIALLKTAPKSAELERVVAVENAVIRVDPGKPANGELPVNVSFEHLEGSDKPELNAAGQTETMAALASAELDAAEAVRQDLIAKAEARFDERLAALNGNMIAVQDKIGMSREALKDCESKQLTAIIQVLGKA